MGDKVKPPKLPGKAPKELKDFLACKIMEVDLDPANATWIPKPEIVPDGLIPTVTPTATGDNALSVTVGWGFVSVTLPVTVTGGQLQVDATDMPGQQATEDWVKAFNDSLKSNNKELDGLEIKNGKIHLTKRVIGAAPQATATTPATPAATPMPPPTTPPPTTPPATAPPATTPTTTPAPTTTPPPADGEGNAMKPGCLIGIILALVLIIGVGLVMFLRDDSNSTSDSKATTSSRASTTTLAPIDETLICARLEILQAVLEDFGVDDPCEVDPDDFWVRADVEESYIDRIRLGDTLLVRLPSGAELEGKVFYRGVDADYATQRDVSRTKRDIRTFEIRLRVDNTERRLALGMTAYVILPMGPEAP